MYSQRVGGVFLFRGDCARANDAASAVFSELCRRGTECEAFDSLSNTPLILARHRVWSVVHADAGVLSSMTHPIIEVASYDEGQEEGVAHILKRAYQSAAYPSPVILLGRGGSGTRLLSDMARSLGVFLGTHLNATGDSLELVDLSYTLLHERLERGEVGEGDVEAFRDAAIAMVLKGSAPLGALWGWKLPETVLFLKDILHRFPAARVIHIVRHPVDVALRRKTHITDRWDHHLGRTILRRASQAVGVEEGAVLREGQWVRTAYSWDYQMECALEALDGLSGERLLTVQFEHLCRDPREVYRKVARFLGVPTGCWHPEIDLSRARLKRADDSRARDVWLRCAATAERFGYRP